MLEITLASALILIAAGTLGWLFSSLAAGGGALLSIPLLNLVLPLRLVAPVLCVGSVIGALHRGWLYRQQVNWSILAWLLPGIISGALLGSWLFSRISLPWLSGLVALFLIVNGLNDYLFKGRLSFPMRLAWFLPAGFATALLSALIGAVGPVMNPFYLNYRVEKEEMIATKAISTLLMQLSKLAGYLWFLPDIGHWLALGVLLGIGAVFGNRLGQAALKRISREQFRHIASALLVLSGMMMLISMLGSA
ncbi:sulfite exporter TauE/SafE family protein [Marinobacterium arenosum]|uniref:sulfite exporter TauE/SafE family protein n=1 Tax=Marinobacterium arenosum TaxID=2862496 RepID=UPI001C97777B|nr:sulfite exporter TauE/SafE family protein [Marinobacterium arenosum]MBY4676128.1 sulfite exporter TauE/SafE family protein [Marinobacterium arenosum]